MKNFVNHSGGCPGADMTWENEGNKYGVHSIAYSFPGHHQDGANPKILSQIELQEGLEHVIIADQSLNRHIENLKSGYVLNLLCRNWFQVKNATAIYAVGTFNKDMVEVSGGTGWAVQMAVDSGKPTFFYDQIAQNWFEWFDGQFIPLNRIIHLTEHFAGVGTRKINEFGIKAIQDVYKINCKRR